MPEALPWRYREDAYYQKGMFAVEFDIEPEGQPLDEAARRRALQQLLLTLRDETNLKVSSFVDVWGDEGDESVEPLDDEVDLVEAAVEPIASAEFVVYNKLGVTSLAKLRRFMTDHLKGDISPRVILIDPEAGDRFKATRFTIRYLFNEFVAHHAPDDWDRLRELMNTEDRGYRELTRTAAHKESTMQRNHDSIEDLVLDLIDHVQDGTLETAQDIVAAVSWLVQDDHRHREIVALYLEDPMAPDPDFNWPRGGGTLIELLNEAAAAYVAEVAWDLLNTQSKRR